MCMCVCERERERERRKRREKITIIHILYKLNLDSHSRFGNGTLKPIMSDYQ